MMKALLSQWIGGSTMKQNPLAGQQSDIVEDLQNSAGTESQSFLGFMMDFMGMGQNPEASTDSSSKTNGRDELQGKHPEKENSQGGFLGKKMILGDSEVLKVNTGQNKSESAAIEIASKESGVQKKNTTGEKQLHSAATNNEVIHAGSRAAESAGMVSGEASKKGQRSSVIGDQTQKGVIKEQLPVSTPGIQTESSGKKPSSGVGKRKAAGKTNKGQTAQALKGNSQHKNSSTGQRKLDNLPQAKTGVVGETEPPKSKSVDGRSQEPARMNRTEILKTNDNDGKGSSDSASANTKLKQQLQNGNGKKIGVRKPAQTEFKKVQTSSKESQEPAKNNSQNIAKGSTPDKPRPMGHSAPNNSSSLGKSDAGVGKLMPGNMVNSQSANSAEVEMDLDLQQDFKGNAENMFKEVALNEIKSTQMGEAAGRKSFSRQLAQISRQQVSQQAQSTSRETAQWQHHRFMLEDGKAIHVASRSTEGTLQLQLSAGNGELGKMLHHHLQDIQQHVQQELKIKIDLQLQNLSGGPADQQTENSDGERQSRQQYGAGSGDSNTAPAQSDTHQQVRYFGFNNNEWTA